MDPISMQWPPTYRQTPMCIRNCDDYCGTLRINGARLYLAAIVIDLWYAIYNMHCILSILFYSFRSMPLGLCILFYTYCIMQIFSIPCYVHLLIRMHLVLYTTFLCNITLYYKHLILCITFYEYNFLQFII